MWQYFMVMWWEIVWSIDLLHHLLLSKIWLGVHAMELEMVQTESHFQIPPIHTYNNTIQIMRNTSHKRKYHAPLTKVVPLSLQSCTWLDSIRLDSYDILTHRLRTDITWDSFHSECFPTWFFFPFVDIFSRFKSSNRKQYQLIYITSF